MAICLVALAASLVYYSLFERFAWHNSAYLSPNLGAGRGIRVVVADGDAVLSVTLPNPAPY